MYREDYYNLVFGFVAVLSLNFKNKDRKLIFPLSLFLGCVFLSGLVFYHVSEEIGRIVWIVVGSGLIITYVLRLRARAAADPSDYFKFLGIVLVTMYPLNFYTYNWFQLHWDSLIVLSWTTLPVALTIYIYDRYVLNPERMKRKYVIVLIAQVLLMIIAFMYGFFQQTAAQRARIEAESNAKAAIEARAVADQINQELSKKLDDCRAANEK